MPLPNFKPRIAVFRFFDVPIAHAVGAGGVFAAPSTPHTTFHKISLGGV